MDRLKFVADIEATPWTLEGFADLISLKRWRWPVESIPKRILLTGMGSSMFAADVIARRWRALGLNAVAEIASAENSWAGDRDLVVIAISASGESKEVLEFCDRYKGKCTLIGLTNKPSSSMTAKVDQVVDMAAQPEGGGISCRSYRHTVAALFALEAQLLNNFDAVSSIRRAAMAAQDLLTQREVWLPKFVDVVKGGPAIFFIAPVERLSSAYQGALMLREAPRRLAVGCETGDWNHIDVYLTKSLDYRAVIFAGSKYDADAVRWMRDRGSKFVTIGAMENSDADSVRYFGDEDPTVALIAESLVAELVAARIWESHDSDY